MNAKGYHHINLHIVGPYYYLKNEKKIICIIFQNGRQSGRQFPKNQNYTGNCSSLTILCGDIETGHLSDI